MTALRHDMSGEVLAPEIARELVGAHGTLVFGRGLDAVTGTVLRVGDGYLVLRHMRRDRSPAGETITDELTVPLTAVAYFRRTVSDDLDFPEEV